MGKAREGPKSNEADDARYMVQMVNGSRALSGFSLAARMDDRSSALPDPAMPKSLPVTMGRPIVLLGRFLARHAFRMFRSATKIRLRNGEFSRS